MMIPEDKVEEVKAATDVVDVVGDYVRLKKAGSNFKGLCPFHNEKTPSFNVNPSMGIYKCFGCGEGGDAISFLMKVEGLGFTETVRMLAERAGIDLPEEGAQDPHADEKEGILHALRFAARFYFDQLTKTEEGKRRGLAYFESRGLSKETIKRFGLGYAPDQWDGLLKAAAEAQIKPEILDAAGLVLPNKNGDGFHDRFRERAMFPILSHVGKVLGFGGRVLPDSTPPMGDYVPPKYINSPETRVYHKSRVLYGLFQGKQEIRKTNLAVLVEGYTDLISMVQAGISNVVATCGTSLTTEHVKLVGRYASRILLIYDADDAGAKAALASSNLIHRCGLKAFVLELPDGSDPDEYAREFGSEAFEALVEERLLDPIAFRILKAEQAGATETSEGITETIRELVEAASFIQDPILRDRKVTEIANAYAVADIYLFKQLDELVKERAKDYNYEVAELNWKTKSQKRVNQAELPSEADVPAAPRSQTAFRMRPEEGALIRLMLQLGRPMVEHILGHMALDEFSEGPVRETVTLLLDQYQRGAIDRDAFVNGTYGPLVQRIATGVLVDRHAISENWRLAGINVPELNGAPYEAAASAMTLLKLDRVSEAIALANRKTYAAEQAGEDLTELQHQMQQLQRLKVQIERREFFEWDKNRSAS